MVDISMTGKNLSIVLQGGIFKKNSIDVANITSEYRNLFPDAEIVLSVSSSDFLDPSKDELTTYKNTAKNQDFIRACNILNSAVDTVVFCGDALPLPPVNIKHPRCNANYQIEAAKCGLQKATREFVLRVRNDFLFKDNSFLIQYKEMSSNPRGMFSVFQERIMICSLFTLNPYAVERLPFHYSDWFHLGKLSDVRLLWNIPHINLNYMTYYMNNPYLPGSNELERHFLAKTAVEQYISFGFFSKKFPNIKLSCHNDIRSRRESIDILLDNFCILDDKKTSVYFPKYMKDFSFRPNEKICISHKSWDLLSRNRQIDPETILTYNKESIYGHTISSFPFRLNMSDMHTKIGMQLGKEIVVPKTDSGGVVVFGPHFEIVEGRYRARAYISSLVSKETTIKMSATLEHGKEVLHEAQFSFNDYHNNFSKTENFLTLDLDFTCPHKVGCDFEIVLDVDNVEDMAISHIEIFEAKRSLRTILASGRNKNAAASRGEIFEAKEYPRMEEMPLLFRCYMNISAKIMKKSLVEKRNRNPYAFFHDSKSILARYPKKIYLSKYKAINKEGEIG